MRYTAHMFTKAHGDPMRVVLVIAGIFAVLSIGVLGYVLFPTIFSGKNAGLTGQNALPTLQDRERALEELGSTAPVTPALTAKRQQMLASLDPQQSVRAGTSKASSTSAQKKVQQESAAVPQTQFEAQNASKLNTLNKLNAQ